MDKIHTWSRFLLCTLSKSKPYLCRRMLEKTFQDYELWFWLNFASLLLWESYEGKVMFNTFLNFISALNKPAGRFQSSQVSHCFKHLMGSKKHGKKINVSQDSICVDELQDLKIKFRFSNWLKFSTKQKTERAVPVSRSWYSRHCKFSSDLSNCTSFSGITSKASANEGPGLWVLL